MKGKRGERDKRMTGNREELQCDKIRGKERSWVKSKKLVEGGQLVKGDCGRGCVREGKNTYEWVNDNLPFSYTRNPPTHFQELRKKLKYNPNETPIIQRAIKIQQKSLVLKSIGWRWIIEGSKSLRHLGTSHVRHISKYRSTNLGCYFRYANLKSGYVFIARKSLSYKEKKNLGYVTPGKCVMLLN